MAKKGDQPVALPVLEDKIRPDEASDYRWKVTCFSAAWRYLLNGDATSIIKHSTDASEVGSKDIDELLFKLIEVGKGLELLNTIQRVYTKGFAVKPETLVYALTICTCSEKLDVKTKAYSLVNEICDQSASFLQFIDYHEKICKSIRKTTGWSRGHRKAVQSWYSEKAALEIAKAITKCPRYNHWTHKDVLRLAHVKPTNEGQEVVSSFIVSGLKKTLEKFKNESEKKADDSQKVLQFLEQAMSVRAGQSTVDVVVPLCKKLKLSWDYVPCHLHKDIQLWKGLISYIPISIMIPNVCRMAKLKLFEDDSKEKQIFIQRCSDAREIKDSGVHPYSILMYRELYKDSMGDKHRRVSWFIDEKINNGLDKAFSLALQYNLKPTGKRFFITIDASNSMKAHIINNNFVQCRVAAACMALCIARAEKKTVVKAFSKELADIQINETTKLEDIVQRLEETPLGGTDCSRPIILAKNKKMKIDVFVVFTDKETWSGKTAPKDALRQYRKALKIPAKLIVVALNTEGTVDKVVADPDDRGMLDIFGFSPSITKIISNFSTFNY